LQCLPGGGDGIGAAVTGLDGHEPSVGLLGVKVEADDPLEYICRSVSAAGLLFEFGQSEMGVEHPAMKVLASWLNPHIVGADHQVAGVGIDGKAQRGSGLVVMVGSRGRGEG